MPLAEGARWGTTQNGVPTHCGNMCIPMLIFNVLAVYCLQWDVCFVSVFLQVLFWSRMDVELRFWVQFP